MQEETATSYETPYELMVRANMADLTSFPELASMAKDMAAGNKVDPSTLSDLPDTVIPQVLFAIGARGITILIEELFHVAKTDDDVNALAGFSHFRHDILEANASVPKR